MNYFFIWGFAGDWGKKWTYNKMIRGFNRYQIHSWYSYLIVAGKLPIDAAKKLQELTRVDGNKF
jgi:hypothetical protein